MIIDVQRKPIGNSACECCGQTRTEFGILMPPNSKSYTVHWLCRACTTALRDALTSGLATPPPYLSQLDTEQER